MVSRCVTHTLGILPFLGARGWDRNPFECWGQRNKRNEEMEGGSGPRRALSCGMRVTGRVRVGFDQLDPERLGVVLSGVRSLPSSRFGGVPGHLGRRRSVPETLIATPNPPLSLLIAREYQRFIPGPGCDVNETGKRFDVDDVRVKKTKKIFFKFLIKKILNWI